MKKRFNVFVCVIMLTLNVQAQKDASNWSMKGLIGCWHDLQSKEWLYGFFEKFAVYDNEFWDYQSVDFNKNKAAIVLQKGNEVLKLKLTFNKEADSICSIISSKDGKGKLMRHFVIPEFTSTDRTVFIDNGYKWDSVTIVGYMHNSQRTMNFKVSIPSFFSENYKDYYANIDSLGRFRITVPVNNTSAAYIDWQENGLLLQTVLEPGEKFFLYYDDANKEICFMGSNSRLKQELVNYDQYSSGKLADKSPSYNADMDHDIYLLEHQKLYNQQKELFDNYLFMHPQVSEKFKYYKEKDILVRHASKLIQRCFKLRRNFDKEHFSKTYTDYLNEICKQIPIPYSLCADVSYFLTYYFDYYNNLRTYNVTSSTIEVLRYLDKEKIHKLTDQQKADLKDYEMMISTVAMGQNFNIDSLRVKAMVAPYEKAVARATQLLNDAATMRLVERYASIIPAVMEMKKVDQKIICFDSIPVAPILQELMVTQAMCNLLFHENKALTEQCIDYFKSLVNNDSFRELVLSQQKKFIQLANLDLEYTESLKQTKHLEGIGNADELLEQLISPYKGKVIFIDIWGTWCGPCKAEMKSVPAIREALKGKDVIYMYFANNSPEDSWKNIIKENRLTGPDIVHYNLPRKQEKLLEQLFSVKFFPTHILIDKEGNIADKNAPGPSHKEMLLKKINELLTK